jgi:site-specific DNA recombinase
VRPSPLDPALQGHYTYFYCLGQKDRRKGTGCRERYVAADQLEAEIENLYGRIEVPDDWADGLRQAIAADVATHHEDTTAECELLANYRERLEAERFKLMEAYYANAIDVTMLRREQERIGTELRAVESRQAVVVSSLDDWQEVMNLALRFSTNCARAYRRAGHRTRKLFNTAVLDEVHARDGHVVEAGYKEPSISSSLCRSSNTTGSSDSGGVAPLTRITGDATKVPQA